MLKFGCVEDFGAEDDAGAIVLGVMVEIFHR